MAIELNGSTGRFVLEDNCQLRFERNGRVLLQSSALPAFVLHYGVEFSVNGMLRAVQRGDALEVVFGTVQPDLTIALEVEPTETGFRLLWLASAPFQALGVSWNVRPQGPWYGHGERLIQTWPLDRQQVLAAPHMPYDHAPDGTLSIGTPLWLSAGGAGLLVEEGLGDLDVTLGRSDDGLLRLSACAPEPHVRDMDVAGEQLCPRLAVDVLLADTLPEVFRLALRFLGSPTSAPPDELFAAPIWTTSAQHMFGITQADVLEFASSIVARGYPRSVLEIDDRWQTTYGACEFDTARFPDPGAMVDTLHAQGFKVTLSMPPFFAPQGAAFTTAREHGFLVRHPATAEPYLVRWWHGYGGLLDVSNRDALDWWLTQLQSLERAVGIDGFKFDGGEGNFLPTDALTALPMTRRQYADRYVQWVAEHFSWTVVRSGWRAQRHGLLFREWNKWSRWGLDNGLHSVLTQALTLSLIGYPFVLPGMIGGNAYRGELPDGELMVRWAQLSALLPAMQFSIPPWQFGDEVDTICRRYAALHAEIAPYIQSLVADTLRDGTPIVRPVFWHAPGDHTALMVDDQFLLGDLLLVAPVVKQGQRRRNIYLPRGHWRDRWSGTLFEGPCWLQDHDAPLDGLPLFERLRDGL